MPRGPGSGDLTEVAADGANAISDIGTRADGRASRGPRAGGDTEADSSGPSSA